MTHYSYLATAAFIEGIFAGIFVRTGIDATPIGIAEQVISILEPLVSESWTLQIEIIKMSVTIVGFALWIPIVIGIFMVGWQRGLIVFIGIFVSMMLLIGYY